MPETVRETLRLTHDAVLRLLETAVSKASDMGVPECVAVVDASGVLLGFVRMDGANFQAIETAIGKAMTAAGNGRATGDIPPDIGVRLAVASGGRRVNLPGGLPIVVDDKLIGGIGIGSGKGDEDLEVARAALTALPDAKHY